MPSLNTSKETCGNCRFFRASPMQLDTGTCRVAPPAGVMIPMNTPIGQQLGVQGFWPPTSQDEWCGKWEPYPVDLMARN